MKTIKCHDGEVKTTEVIRVVLRQPMPNRGIDYEEMGRRVRILDILDKHMGDELNLEDADHAFLSGLIKSFQFGTADPRLFTLIKDVIEAKASDSA